MSKQYPLHSMVDAIKTFFQVYKAQKQRCLELDGLLNNDAKRNLVCTRPSASKPSCCLRSFTLKTYLHSFEHNITKYFAGDGQQSMSSPVLAVTGISLFWQFYW